MTVARLVPFEDLRLRAQLDSSGNILGFVDNAGRQVQLAIANAAGQIGTAAGGTTAFDSDIVPVNSIAPAITGTPTSTNEQTCDTGTWSGEKVTYTYQWTRDGVDIADATTDKYTLLVDDVDKVIACNVTATTVAGSATTESNEITPAS